jgi:hypothetical protein
VRIHLQSAPRAAGADGEGEEHAQAAADAAAAAARVAAPPPQRVPRPRPSDPRSYPPERARISFPSRPPTSPSPGLQGNWRSGSCGRVLGVIQGLVVGCCLLLWFASEMAKAVMRLAKRFSRPWGLCAKPLTLTCK